MVESGRSTARLVAGLAMLVDKRIRLFDEEGAGLVAVLCVVGGEGGSGGGGGGGCGGVGGALALW